MHILIITDLEGISGVDSMEIMDEESQYYKTATENLMEDTNAAVAGAFAGGADKVTVIDGHRTGFNFVEGMLDPRAEQIPARVFSNMNINGIRLPTWSSTAASFFGSLCNHTIIPYITLYILFI